MITLILNRFEVKQESTSNSIKYDHEYKGNELKSIQFSTNLKDYLICQKITWSPKNLNTNDLNSFLVCSYLWMVSFSCRISPYLCLRTWRLCPIPFITCHFLVVYTLPILIVNKARQILSIALGQQLPLYSWLLSMYFCVWLLNNSK